MTEVKKQDKELLSAGGKLFNISTYAKQKVANKRAKKGYGELKPRETNPYKMFFQYSTSIALAKTAFAPFERVRILSQVRNMMNTNA